ncbi:translocation/assembly module TamB [Prochlorococcus marinus]|uniref:translocation/assembly module TamB n=1 Tax=Prochlorococcus marinus TaxID=1219 RepID=UPI0022B4FB6D|nr:translocation/assembly module TamB domain-containing protein [Prochlorococcus marinus]
MKIKPTKIKKIWLFGALLVSGGCAISIATNHFFKTFFNKSRPGLERQFSQNLGHPIKIGSYQGLRPWGFSIGSSELLQGEEDTSSAKLSGLKVQFAPISSLFSWRPVLIFSINQAKLFLNPNESGSYWVLGDRENGSTPNLDIRIRIDEASSIFLDSGKTEVKTSGKASILLLEKKVKGTLSFLFPNNESFSLKGSGHLNQLSFKARARFKNFGLDNFQSIIFNKYNLIANGRINSDIQFGLQGASILCRGNMFFDDLDLTSTVVKNRSLSTEYSGINCIDRKIVFPTTRINYGNWDFDLNAYMPISQPSTYNINLISSIRSKYESNTPLNIDANLPLSIGRNGFSFGELFAQLELDKFPISSLSSMLGTSVGGNISTNGTISGPLSSLDSELSLEVENPQINLIRLQEKWQGNFKSLSGKGASLKMTSMTPAVPGKLEATLQKDWSLKDLQINRLGGKISLTANQKGYSWEADNFRLDRLEVALPPEKSFKRTFGKLLGNGSIEIDPFLIDGKLTYRFPRLFGVNLKEATIKGNYSGKNYSLNGEIIPPDKGKILIDVNGRIGGSFKGNAIAKGITPNWLTDSSMKILQNNLSPQFAKGSAEDLKRISILSQKSSLDSQLSNWDISRVFLEKYKRKNASKKIVDPSKLKGEVDIKAKLEGSMLSDLKLDMLASGKTWLKGDRDNGVKIKPFTATFRSTALKRSGNFSLINIPFSMLTLFIPTPSSLGGMFGLSGSYIYKKKYPEITAELVLADASFADKEFLLEKGDLYIANSVVRADIAIKGVSSKENVSIHGDIPLSPSLPFDIKVESHGDGLSIFDGLSGGVFAWESGNIDLKLLVRGTLLKPIANGYLVIKEGKFLLDNKLVENFSSQIVFDFNRLEVQKLDANLGPIGTIKSQGSMSIFRDDQETQEVLNVDLTDVKINQQNLDFKVSSKLKIKGSILKPILAGEMRIEDGSISTKRSRSGKKGSVQKQKSSVKENKFYTRTRLPEQTWDYKDPLLLFIQDQDSTATKILNTGIPKSLSSISFDNLKLNLGPDLRIVSQPIASFNTTGSLILDGGLSDDFALRGLVRLLKGRVNLFTTTFDLDKGEPNIALFAPSMGLIPYLDITMTSRVADVIQEPSQLESSNDLALNGAGSVGIGGSRFVKVELIATGPADRVADNFQLRSSPPLPRSQLLDLIGGNSLTMLMSGSEREVLVDLLNRSFLSPVLGNLSGAFSERIQVSLYPAYVSNSKAANEDNEDNEDNQMTTSETSSDDLSPQQAWIAEVGLDLSEKINFSIQTTPNRKDIPPQGTITYQFNPNLGVLGSLDKNGNWKSQLELFVRY